MPIGNLTSQVFANVYLNELDHFIKHDLGIRYYGRYVDDFVLVHPSHPLLKSLIPKISTFLKSKLKLTLHPQKIYLQHYCKGVQFLGMIIKPHHIKCRKRTKGNFYEAIEKQNKVIDNHNPNREERRKFLCSINSYLGILSHYNTYHLRQVFLKQHLNPKWRAWFRTQKDFKKVLKIK